jgi:hypothetical protein
MSGFFVTHSLTPAFRANVFMSLLNFFVVTRMIGMGERTTGERTTDERTTDDG